MTKHACCALLTCSFLVLAVPVHVGDPAASYPRIPPDAQVRFEPNHGQADSRVAFVGRGAGYQVALAPQEAIFRFEQAMVRMKFLGANSTVQWAGDGEFAGRSHYLRSARAGGSISNVPNFRRVASRDIYPGIDVLYYSRARQFAFDFVISPGANPDAIALAFEGADVDVDAEGGITLDTPGRDTLRVGRPTVFQVRGGQRVAVESRFQRHGKNTVRFSLGAYDRAEALVIDPIISYSTYLGGAGDDYARAVAVTPDGAAFATGSTESIDFLSAPGWAGVGNSDVFVVKFARNGEVLYTTFLGGGDMDRGEGIAVDATGAAFVTGATHSSDFPTLNAFQPDLGGDSDAFVAKLHPTGSSLAYSTFLGGSGFDAARGAALDAQGNVVTMGQTLSEDFPMMNARQPWHFGGVEAFVTKVDATGSGLVFSTFHGGSGNDLPFFHQGVTICGTPVDAPGWGVAIDAFGFIHVAGTTESTDFPLANALQTEHKGGLRDAFVSKFYPDGRALIYSTYIGGTGGDSARGLAVDPYGNAYLAGGTKSNDFPITPSAFSNTIVGDYDAFVVKLVPNGSRLAYSTFIGGTDGEGGNGIAVDLFGNVTVVGHTQSADYPVVDGIGPPSPGGTNLFLTKMNTTGSAVLYSSHLGGNGDEQPCGLNMGIAVDRIGSAYIASGTASPDFPVSAAAQPVLAGGFDGFLTKVRTEPSIHVGIRRDGDESRLVVTLGNPYHTTRVIDFQLLVSGPLLGPTPISLVPTPLIFAIPKIAPTVVIDMPLPAALPFDDLTFIGRVVDPFTKLLLDESMCTGSPCNQ
jgi:hypothetical protein